MEDVNVKELKKEDIENVTKKNDMYNIKLKDGRSYSLTEEERIRLSAQCSALMAYIRTSASTEE